MQRPTDRSDGVSQAHKAIPTIGVVVMRLCVSEYTVESALGEKKYHMVYASRVNNFVYIPPHIQVGHTEM